MAAQPAHDSPAWCLRLNSELYTADERATVLAKPLTPEQLNWHPAPGVWSIGQCLDHLCATNDVYVEAMASALDGREHAVVQAITPGWFGRWFIRTYIEPSPRTKRAPAPRKIAPGVEVDASILDRFLQTNQRTREFIDRAGHYDVNRIRFGNPFVRVIRFTVGTGLEILSAHQRRHLLQAERVRETPGFPREGTVSSRA